MVLQLQIEMNFFRRGKCPPRFSPRGASRHRLAMACGHTVLTIRSASRQPRGLPLPPLLVVKCLVLVKSMVDVDAEARSSFVGVDAGYDARLSNLEAGKQISG